MGGGGGGGGGGMLVSDNAYVQLFGFKNVVHL